MPRTHAGSYRQSVTLHRRAGSQRDERGQQTPEFRREGVLRAKVRQLQGSELERAMQVHKEVRWKVETWMSRGISTRDRLEYQGRMFEVLSVADPDERGFKVVVLCRETST